MSDQRDYYGILHVRPDAPAEIVRASYRTMMQRLRLHPDLGGDHQQAQLINEAYAVLSNPSKRAQYDLERHAAFLRRCAPGASGAEHQCLFCAASFSAEHADANGLCAECGSPVRLATRQRTQHSMRRMVQRYIRLHPVEVYTEWPAAESIAGLMRDLSLNGMRFTAKHTFELDRIIKIDCKLCRTLSRVAYCAPADSDGHVIGVEFVTVRFASARGTFVSAQA
jgi:hypothetical protein